MHGPQPLDAVKTRLQSAPLVVGPSPKAGVAGLARNAATIRSVSLAMLREGGVLQFWKGTTPSVLRVVPAVGTHLSILRTAEGYYADAFGPRPMGPLAALVIAGASRAGVALLFQPLGLIKTRMESAAFSHYSNPVVALRSVVQTEGIRGLFRGTMPTILRDSPFSGIYYSAYSWLKHKYGNETAVRTFLLGTVAGFGATIVTQPIDVIRTRAQLSQAGSASMIRIAQDLLREGSVGSFLRGLVPRVTRRILMASATWTVFEEIMQRRAS